MSEPTKSREEGVKYLAHYMNTYAEQFGYRDYTDDTYINDVLYGLGVSLSDEYKFASGYDKFKARLREMLEEKHEPTAA